ncbi:MAG: hypothetical protein NTX64_02060 [Elusimicrobia bacterium]|nr:hypothetical protein [Elusimicrobiota bacterium]
MENKMRMWLLLGTLGASCALYFSVMEQNRPVRPLKAGAGAAASAAQEPAAMTVDDTVLAVLPMLERTDLEARRSALGAIEDAATGDNELSEGVREKAAQAVIAAFTSTPEDTPDGKETKGQALRVAVVGLAGETSRAFAMEIISSTTDTWKLETIQAWLKPGAVSGPQIREKAAELARTDLVPDQLKPQVLRRALGKKAEPEIIALMNTAVGRPALAACAVELQNLGKVEVMSPMLSRLDEAGMLDDHKKMPWISGKLLAEQISKVDGKDLERALKVVYLRPSLSKATAKAVQGRAGHPDANVRKLVARIIPDAVKNESIDVASGEELLLARLKDETDPAVKGEIEGSLAEVRKTRPATEAGTPSQPAQ